MLARVVTLRFDTTTGSFDDTPLREFLKDKQVLSIRNHFFVRHDTPYLAVLVTYGQAMPEAQAPSTELRSSQCEREASWRELLTEEDLPLFNTLRDCAPSAASRRACRRMPSAARRTATTPSPATVTTTSGFVF
jgi:hypothetical protein